MCHQWQKRIISSVIATTSSASLGTLPSRTYVSTVSKRNGCNKHNNKGVITDKLDSNSRNKKWKW